jgi:hypothetical protein
MIEKQLYNNLPRVIYWVLTLIPFKPLRDILESGPRFLKYAAALYNDAPSLENQDQLNILVIILLMTSSY